MFAFFPAIVKSYYTKIQTRFASHSTAPTNKFVQFREILRTFDPLKETPIELYRKIEQLFGAKHSDVVEEFLLFLKPCQAAAVGRFMDHFMLSQMTVFIELLQVSCMISWLFISLICIAYIIYKFWHGDFLFVIFYI